MVRSRDVTAQRFFVVARAMATATAVCAACGTVGAAERRAVCAAPVPAGMDVDAGGGSGAARGVAERARQAVLLATQTLGVSAAEVRRARAEGRLAREELEWAERLTRLYRADP